MTSEGPRWGSAVLSDPLLGWVDAVVPVAGHRLAARVSADLPGDLPYDLAPPLHFLKPWWQRPETWLPWVLALAVAALLVALWRRWRRARAERPAPPPPAAPTPKPSWWWAEVHRLWDEYRTTDPRRGLAELSRLLRDHFAGRLPAVAPHPGLTAGEVAHHADDEAARVLRLVSLHQFGRREPETADFDHICTLAADLLREREGPAEKPGDASGGEGAP